MDFLTMFLAAIMAIFTIASTAIGIQCQNNHNESKSTNQIFLVMNLVCAILVCLGLMIKAGFAIKQASS